MSYRSMSFRIAALGCAFALLAGAALAQPQQQKKKSTKPAPAPAAQAPAPAPAPETATPAVSAPAEPQQPDNKELLAYLWKNPGPVRYEISTVDQTTQTSSKGPQELNSEKHVWLTMVPAPADKSRTILTVSWDRVTFKLVQPKKTIEVDSAAAENPNADVLAPLPKAMEALKGKTVRIQMAPSGLIEKVEGLEDVANTVRNAWPANAQRDQIIAYVFPLTTAELAAQINKAVLRLPVKRVEPGYTQPEQVKVSANDVMTGTLTFTGAEGDGPSKVLVVKQDLSAKPLPPASQNGLNYVREKFEMTNVASINAETKTPVKFESTQQTNYVARKPASDPNAAPDLLIQTVTKITTLLLPPEGTPDAAPAAAPAPGGTPAPSTGAAPAPAADPNGQPQQPAPQAPPPPQPPQAPPAPPPSSN